MQVEAVLSELEAALGHAFCSPDLLVRALTHRSLANERALSEQGTGGPETAAQTGGRRGAGASGCRGFVWGAS